MKRSSFLKVLLGWPFGGFLAKKLQSGGSYLLNRFFVAGFQYYAGPSLIEDITVGEMLTLKADPENSYDRFAVEIRRKGMQIGHVPRSDNKHISRLLLQGVSLTCKVAEVNPDRETWNMLKVEIYL